MKILVFGSREWVWEDIIYRVLSKLPKDTILIHGAAPGADRIAGRLGKEEFGFEVRPYPADWKGFGNSAGPIRNAGMLKAEHPDLNGVKIDKGFGFSTGRENKGTHDMSEKLWVAKVRFEILFSPGSV